MLSLCKKFINGLPSLNYAVFSNTDFTWVRSADKVVEIPKTWFSVFTQTKCFKKTILVGTPYQTTDRYKIIYGDMDQH